MSFELRPYQVAGADWLVARKHALLADEPGVGKTAQAIAACDGVGAENVLVLCPASAKHQWRQRFDIVSVFGRQSQVLPNCQARPLPRGVVIASYDLAIRKPLAGRLLSREWDVVIADESHYCASRKAKRSRYLWAGLTSKAARVWCLTGTPAPNHVGETWAMLNAFGWYKGGHPVRLREHPVQGQKRK